MDVGIPLGTTSGKNWAQICGVGCEMGVIRKSFLYRFFKRMSPMGSFLRVEHIESVIASIMCSVLLKVEFGCTRGGFLESFYEKMTCSILKCHFEDLEDQLWSHG